MTLFLLLGRVHLRDDESSSPRPAHSLALPIAAVLATCNLAWLATYLNRENDWGTAYR